MTGGGPAAATAHGAERDPARILAALPTPVFVLDGADVVVYANAATERFLQTGAATLLDRRLDRFLSADSPIFGLVGQVRRGGRTVTENGVTVAGPRIGAHFVSVAAAPMGEPRGATVVFIQERSIARKLNDGLVHRGAARSVTAMAAMLAHEVKNPLSGIRGAAQLLEQNAEPEDRKLTRLICDETDRIVALVDRMDMFADERPLDRRAVNIHEVLNRVRALAESGFARHVRFHERYDPSLPPVYGNRDALIQALLNLVKNAAEAAPAKGAEIALSTAFRQGIRLAVPGMDSRVEVPICVGVQDNGGGIPEDLRAHLFEPFVSAKAGGKGLGLALVAKIVGDHGGAIEVESGSRRTLIRMMLPMATDRVPGP